MTEQVLTTLSGQSRLLWVCVLLVGTLAASSLKMNAELSRRGVWMQKVDGCVEMLLIREAEENDRLIAAMEQVIRREVDDDDRWRKSEHDAWAKELGKLNDLEMPE